MPSKNRRHQGENVHTTHTYTHLGLVVQAGLLDVAADRFRGRSEQELALTHRYRRRRGGLTEVALSQRLSHHHIQQHDNMRTAV